MAKARSDRQLVAAVFRGQLTKPARDLSPAYVHRLAESIRRQRAAGVRRPVRQVARGHTPRTMPSGATITTEHPRGRVRRGGELVPWSPETKATPLRKGSGDRHVAGHGVILQRDFRVRSPAWRWLRSLPADVGVQAIGHGELAPLYGKDDADEEDAAEAEAEAVETGGPVVVRSWRAFYTGNAAGDPDENGASAASYGAFQAAEERVFVPGTVDSWIVRWQR